KAAPASSTRSTRAGALLPAAAPAALPAAAGPGGVADGATAEVAGAAPAADAPVAAELLLADGAALVVGVLPCEQPTTAASGTVANTISGSTLRIILVPMIDTGHRQRAAHRAGRRSVLDLPVRPGPRQHCTLQRRLVRSDQLRHPPHWHRRTSRSAAGRAP